MRHGWTRMARTSGSVQKRKRQREHIKKIDSIIITMRTTMSGVVGNGGKRLKKCPYT